MSLSAIISALVAIDATVTGVKNSYDIDSMPTSLTQAKLPALIHLPEGGAGNVMTFQDGVWELNHRIRVQIIYTAVGQSTMSTNLSGLVTLLDAYIAKLQDYGDISGTCDAAHIISYTPIGTVPYGNVDYLGMEVIVQATEYQV